MHINEGTLVDLSNIVFIEPETFIRHWRSQHAQQEPKKGFARMRQIFSSMAGPSDLQAYERRLLQTTPETALQYALADTPPYASLCNNRIGFQNGRHRTVNMAALGAPFIPMRTDLQDIENFKVLFGIKEQPSTTFKPSEQAHFAL